MDQRSVSPPSVLGSPRRDHNITNSRDFDTISFQSFDLGMPTEKHFDENDESDLISISRLSSKPSKSEKQSIFSHPSRSDKRSLFSHVSRSDKSSIFSHLRSRNSQQPESLPPPISTQFKQPTVRMLTRKPLADAVIYQVAEQDPPEAGRAARFQGSIPSSLLKTWWFEAICCLLIVCALAAIMVTIFAFEGKPVPQLPFGISIASVLAAYGVIFRAAAGFVLSQGLGQLKWTHLRYPQPLHDLHVYDEATRGPLGCIQLLSNFRVLQLPARLGAFATLVLLIIDPFTQQLINFKESQVANSAQSSASLPRTSVWFGNGYRDGANNVVTEPRMRAAVNAGIFVSNGSQVAHTCATDECSYSEMFHTIGYCHSCDDVSSQIVVTTNLTYPIPDPNDNSTTLGPSNSTSVSLHVGQGLLSVNSSARNSFYMAAGPVTGQDPSGHYPLSQYAFLIPGNDIDPAFTDTRGTRAFQCSLDPCVRTMKSSVVSSILVEETLATYLDWSFDSVSNNQTRSMVDLSCLSSEQRQALLNVGYQFTSSDNFIPYNGSVLADGTVLSGDVELLAGVTQPNSQADPVINNISASCIYTISEPTTRGMTQFLRYFFNGNVVGHTTDGPFQGSQILYDLYYQGATLDTFNDAMSSVANSMTAYIRQTSIPAQSIPVNGTSLVTTTVLVARWEWITFVGALALMVIVFFIAMVCETGLGQDNGRHDFKASSLAIMSTGLDEATRGRLNGALQSGRIAKLEAISKRIPVRFVQLEGKFMHTD